MSQRVRRWTLALAFLVAGMTGCGDRSVNWSLYNVRGHLPDLSFSLKGAGDKTVTQDAFDNKTVLLFFGYASCPDVCPTTMAQLTEVLRRLGDDARDVRILFVSVDPHRDTPDVLQTYVNAFNRNAVGLTGDEREVANLARRYRVAYQIEKPKPGATAEQYDVTHSRGVYIFDKHGKARLLASDSDQIEVVTHDLKQLLDITRGS